MSNNTVSNFLRNCPPVGAKKKFLVTCNGKPFAGFDKQSEAKAAKDMYSAQLKLKKGGMAHCSTQEWAIIQNPDYG